MTEKVQVHTSTRLLLNLSKALKAAVKDKIEADNKYMQMEKRYKQLKADIMMSSAVTGLGSREMREAQAELIIATEPDYEEYLLAKLESRKTFEWLEMIKELLVTGRMLAGQGMLVNEMVDDLLGGITNENVAEN